MRFPLTILNETAASDSKIGPILLALGVVVLTATFIIRMRRRFLSRPSSSQDQRPRAPLDPTRQRQTLEALMVEVQELTRLCAAQMENRATRLEQLIAQADNRLARLEGQNGSREHSFRIPERQTQPSSFLRQDSDPLTSRIYQLADKGITSVEIARELDEQTGKVDLILALRDR